MNFQLLVDDHGRLDLTVGGLGVDALLEALSAALNKPVGALERYDQDFGTFVPLGGDNLSTKMRVRIVETEIKIVPIDDPIFLNVCFFRLRRCAGSPRLILSQCRLLMVLKSIALIAVASLNYPRMILITSDRLIYREQSM
jgi:hypothetical protein